MDLRTGASRLALLGAVAALCCGASNATAGVRVSERAAAGSSLQQVTWYAADLAAPLPAGAPAGGAAAAGVPAGDVGVGSRPGIDPTGAPSQESDKITLLAFDVSGVKSGDHVSSFSFTVPVDLAQPGTAAVIAAGPPALVACSVLRSWSGNRAAGPQPLTQAPPVDCRGAGPVAYDPKSASYTFTAVGLAQQWVDSGNTGVALEADPAATAPFTLALGPARAVTATLASSAGSPARAGATQAATTPDASTGAIGGPPGSVSGPAPLTGSLSGVGAISPGLPPVAPQLGPVPGTSVPSVLAVPQPALPPVHVTASGSALTGQLPYLSALLIVPLLLVIGMGLSPAHLDMTTTSRSRLSALLDRTPVPAPTVPLDTRSTTA